MHKIYTIAHTLTHIHAVITCLISLCVLFSLIYYMWKFIVESDKQNDE